MKINTCGFGDVRDVLREIAESGIKTQTCVTSPPYFGLRDYGVPGQIGLEPTPDAYISAMVEVFRCVRDVLADDGTLWLNIGDSYAANRGYQVTQTKGGAKHGPAQAVSGRGQRANDYGLKPKDLIGIPWMLAFALRADGWYLRQDIIWSKPNPMPESVTDRCTKAHEYVFLLSKSEHYFIDPNGMKEPAVATHPPGNHSHKYTTAYKDGAAEHRTKAGFVEYAKRTRSARDTFKRESSKREQTIPGQLYGTHRPDRDESTYSLDVRNRRSVWTIATMPYSGAHFAVMPEALVEPCVIAGTRPGDVVLDPFMGSGTVAAVAQRLGRQWIGAELNPEYRTLQADRTRQSSLVLETA